MSRRIASYLRANLLGLIAIFIALTTGAYAAGLEKNSVKSKQLKDGAVKTADLADASVSAAKIIDGTIASADIAKGSIGGPEIADGSIGGLEVAEGSVGTSEITDGSIGAADLSVATTAALKDGCPGSMNRIGNTLCAEKTATGPSTWLAALDACAAKKLRMPTVDEAYLVFTEGLLGGGVSYWTNAVRGPDNEPIAQAVVIDGTDGSARSKPLSNLSPAPFHFCVSSPSDG